MKPKLVRSLDLLALVAVLALLVGFAGIGRAQAQPVEPKNTFEFKNGATWSDLHRAYVCRGTNVDGVEDIDTMASETLILHGTPPNRDYPGDEVEVEILDTTGVIQFAELENPSGRLKFKKDRLEIVLESTSNGEIFADSTMRITWHPGVGPESVVFADGALAFTLAGRSDRRDIDEDKLPVTATAVSPPPNPGNDTGYATGRIRYLVSIDALPMSDLLLNRIVTGSVSMRGQVNCPWVVTFPNPARGDEVGLTREAVIESDLPSLNGLGFRRDDQPVPAHGKNRETGNLKPVRLGRTTVEDDFAIQPQGFGRKRLNLLTALSLGAVGNSTGTLRAVESLTDPVVVHVTPICPF